MSEPPTKRQRVLFLRELDEPGCPDDLVAGLERFAISETKTAGDSASVGGEAVTHHSSGASFAGAAGQPAPREEKSFAEQLSVVSKIMLKDSHSQRIFIRYIHQTHASSLSFALHIKHMPAHCHSLLIKHMPANSQSLYINIYISSYAFMLYILSHQLSI